MYSFSKYLIQCLLYIEDTQIKKLLFEVDLQVKSLQKRTPAAPTLPLSSAFRPITVVSAAGCVQPSHLGTRFHSLTFSRASLQTCFPLNPEWVFHILLDHS